MQVELPDPADYMATAQVDQLTRKAQLIKDQLEQLVFRFKTSYIFYDIFPTNISAIDLSYDTSDTIEEFTVEFQVQYWAPSTKTNTGTTP
jgi:hypothetical protein